MPCTSVFCFPSLLFFPLDTFRSKVSLNSSIANLILTTSTPHTLTIDSINTGEGPSWLTDNVPAYKRNKCTPCLLPPLHPDTVHSHTTKQFCSSLPRQYSKNSSVWTTKSILNNCKCRVLGQILLSLFWESLKVKRVWEKDNEAECFPFFKP